MFSFMRKLKPSRYTTHFVTEVHKRGHIGCQGYDGATGDCGQTPSTPPTGYVGRPAVTHSNSLGTSLSTESRDTCHSRRYLIYVTYQSACTVRLVGSDLGSDPNYQIRWPLIGLYQDLDKDLYQGLGFEFLSGSNNFVH